MGGPYYWQFWGVTMLILIFLALCAIGGFPWWAYVGGIAVWLFASDWSN